MGVGALNREITGSAAQQGWCPCLLLEQEGLGGSAVRSSWCIRRPHPLLLFKVVGWLVVLGLTALWDSISVYIGASPREREKERRVKIDESKNVQTTPTRTYCKRKRPLPYSNSKKYVAPALEVYPASSRHPTTPSVHSDSDI